jgi:hypothetical protein
MRNEGFGQVGLLEIIYSNCHPQLRLIALINQEAVAKKILTAMRLPTVIPVLHPARPPRPPPEGTGGSNDWPAMTGRTERLN